MSLKTEMSRASIAGIYTQVQILFNSDVLIVHTASTADDTWTQINIIIETEFKLIIEIWRIFRLFCDIWARLNSPVSHDNNNQ